MSDMEGRPETRAGRRAAREAEEQSRRSRSSKRGDADTGPLPLTRPTGPDRRARTASDDPGPIETRASRAASAAAAKSPRSSRSGGGTRGSGVARSAPRPAAPVTSRAAPPADPGLAETPPPVTSRAARRAAAEPNTRRGRRSPGSVPREPSAAAGRFVTLLTTLALGALIALSAYAGTPELVGLSVGLAGLILAWGWPTLLGSPSRKGSSLVLAFGTISCVAVTTLTDDDPFLRYLPVALAVSFIGAFLHQLLRRDGRPRLSESVAITASGLAIIASGAALVPIVRTLDGEKPLVIAAGAIAGAAVIDLLAGRMRAWLLPLAMFFGAAAAVGAAIALDGPGFGPASLMGVLAGGISHALRRVVAVLPQYASARGRLAAGAASVLVCGTVVYVLSRLLIN